MKKILSIVCIILVAFVLFGFAACGDTSNVNEKPGEETNKFTGITFEDKTFIYDGKEHTLEISGTLPTGAKVVYENNSGTNAGTYEATATVTCENYETLELTATLTISKAKFTGITFEDKTFVYDGKEHTLEISGTLPTGAKVVYENNSGTNAGTYEATATVTCENYETLELTATLTISKAKITGITFENKTFVYDGKSHSLEIIGTLPANTNVTYENNEQTEGGSYTVKATLTNPNYETLELTAKLNIRTLADAKAIVDKILKRPETWSFMPKGLREESMAYSEMPVTQFSGNYVNVNSIGKQFIGKQMNVVYDILGNSQSVLEKADFVFAAGEAIAAVYQTFINGNPDDYNSFSGSIEVGGINCSLAIELQGEVSVLTLGNNTVNVRLSADSANNTNTGRIQLTDGAVVKYVATENSLRFAVDLEISGIKIAQSLEFIRNEEAVTGYVYEYYGVGDKAIKTTALFTSNENYTIITGDKRETDDMLIEAYEEVYDSQTGEYIGAEVTETIKFVDYDTLWFNLYDVSGFSTVKVEDAQNGVNADTVYVNGNANPFEPKNFGGIGLDRFSRRYDIEMKEVWYIVATEKEGEVVYESEKALIPMLFVNKGKMSEFPEDVIEKNDYLSGVSLPDSDAITVPFESSQSTYLALKELVTYEELQEFINS